MSDPKNPHGQKPEDKLANAAVALRYQPEVTNAPRVVAKGRGELAERILEIAFAAGIKVRQDADLVEILEAVDLDREIPLEAFQAVAEILAYVYRANGTLPPQPPRKNPVAPGPAKPPAAP